MKGFAQLVAKIKSLKRLGYVKTHRIGNTGIGKTLEDLLGIKENNVPGPNGAKVELKSARKNAKSMLTLFTKSPLPDGANSILLKMYGYPSRKGNKKKELHSTVNALNYNTLKGKSGFKITLKKTRVELTPSKGKSVAYWDRDTLKKSFERKLYRLLYVKADSKGVGRNEQFWFNEVWLLKGFNFNNFIKLLRKGDILVDVRIGQYPDGRPHDHGTGFRVNPNKLDLCFSERTKIM